MNKKVVASVLTLSMLLSSSSLAFAANNKGRGQTNVPTYVNEKTYKEDLVKGNGFGNNAANTNNGNAYGNVGKLVSAFRDLDTSHWAYRHANRMRYKHVIKGYEDGSFRPSNAIKEVEAIVMAVRLWGLEDELVDADLEDLVVPTWAEDYVQIALDKDWIEPEDFQAEKAATRSWVAKLLVKAMDLDLPNDPDLSFTDAAAIDEEDAPYIAAAVEAELLEGYPDNTFKPNKPVTRAEMVTLLDRADDEIDNEDQETEVEGVFHSVDDNSIKIDGHTYEVAENVDICLEDEDYEDVVDIHDVNDINDGAQVNAILEDDVVVYLEVLSVEVEGVVDAINDDTLELYNEDTEDIDEYALAEDVKVVVDHVLGDLNDVDVDDEVEVTLVNNQVVEINVEVDAVEEEEVMDPVEGVFEGVHANTYDPDEDETHDSAYGDYIEITTYNDNIEHYLLAETVEVTMDEEEDMTLADINEGAKIKLTFNADDEVEAIEVLPVHISGTVTEEVYYNSDVIEIEYDDDYAIADEVSVIIDHDSADLEEVDNGDEVDLTLYNNEVTVIRVLLD